MLSLLLSGLTLASVVFVSDAGTVSMEMQSFIGELLGQYLSEIESGQILQPRVVYPAVQDLKATERPSPMLPVIIWDPLIQFPDLFKGFCCPYCVLDQKPGKLKTSSMWNDGTRGQLSPRKVYDLHHSVLLVARRYRCTEDSDHCFVSTHVSIMEFLEEHKSVSFKLTVKSGYFYTLSEAICAMVDRGMSFKKIENIIKSIYQRTGVVMINHSKKEAVFPSAKFIEMIFLDEFYNREQYYISSIKKTTADWISADHTFKSVMNIGYPRKEDGKWINVFNALFCVLNEKGQVIKWRFTKSTKAEETEILFRELSCRLRAQRKQIQAIYVDNCCQIRKKLRAFFNDQHLQVKLDLFHAINRFLVTIPKRWSWRKAIARQYRNVFRAAGDYGKTRKRETPSSETLLQNIKIFERKWKGMRSGRKLVLNKKSLRAIENIKIHIKEGCLSDIPTGCGTNKNERLHRKLRKIAGRSKLGVKLAYALFTRAFHLINTEIDEKQGSKKEVVETIDVEENFGFYKNANRSVLPADILSFNESKSDQDNLMLEAIINRADFSSKIYNNIKGNGLDELESHDFRRSLLVFQSMNKEHNTNHSSQSILDQRAENMGFKRQPSPKDGDCFFFSLALQISNLLTTCDEKVEEQFNKLGIKNQQSITEIARRLRQLVVQEWLSNSEQYQHFVQPGLDYYSEAKRFLMPGHFAASIGDAMPLAAANVLHLPLVLVTSVTDWPLTIVTPQVQAISNVPLYLAFTQEESGHYDSLIELSRPQFVGKYRTVREIRIKCRCGVNNKNANTLNCCEAPKQSIGRKRKYSSRCKCLKAGIKCGDKCKCKSCGNGRNSPEAKQRKNYRSKFIKTSFTKRITEKPFLLQREGADYTRSSFSVLELMILEFCLLSLGIKSCKNKPEKVAKLYNSCIDFYNRSTAHKLTRRSIIEIKKEMNKHKSSKNNKK